MEGDIEIKDCEYDVGEVNHINWENILKHNKDPKYRYIHVGSLQIQTTPYNIMVKILISMLYFVILGILNLIIRLSLGWI